MQSSDCAYLLTAYLCVRANERGSEQGGACWGGGLSRLGGYTELEVFPCPIFEAILSSVFA